MNLRTSEERVKLLKKGINIKTIEAAYIVFNDMKILNGTYSGNVLKEMNI